MATIIQFPQINNLVVPRTIPSVPVRNADFYDDTPQLIRHAATPIKDPNDVVRVCEYLDSHGRYRDNMLFTAGVNLGFRCGDLLRLKWGHFLNADGTWKSSITLQEDKTEKLRTVYLNEAVLLVAYKYSTYLTDRQPDADRGVDLGAFCFRSESTRQAANKPLTVYSVERILKEVINEKLGISIKAGTHCMRKTFGYHMVMGARDRTRAVELLSKMLNHASTAVTMSYIGITDDEIRAAYENLNLGLLDPAACVGVSRAV